MTILGWIGVGISALLAMWLGGRMTGKSDAKQRTALDAAERQAKTTKEIAHADLGIGASDGERIKRLSEFAAK